MVLLMFAALLAQASDLTLDVPGQAFTLTAPTKVTYAPGKLIEVTARGSEEVVWEVILTPTAEVDVRKLGNTLLMAMPPPGTTVVVLGASSIAGKAVMAKAAFTIEGDKAAAAPGAQSSGAGDLPTDSKVKNITWVYDGGKAKPPALDLANGVAVKVGATLRTLDVTTTDPKAAQAVGFFKRYFDEAKGPVLVLQDNEGNVLGAYKMPQLTAEGMTAAVGAALKGK